MPPTTRSQPRDGSRNEISRAASSWWWVGTLLRDNSRYILSQPVSVIPELPTSVDYINVALHHILPSVIVLTLDVHLNEHASDKVTAFKQNPTYLKLHCSRYFIGGPDTRKSPRCR